MPSWNGMTNETTISPNYSLVIVIKAVEFFEFDASVTREKRRVSAHVWLFKPGISRMVWNLGWFKMLSYYRVSVQSVLRNVCSAYLATWWYAFLQTLLALAKTANLSSASISLLRLQPSLRRFFKLRKMLFARAIRSSFWKLPFSWQLQRQETHSFWICADENGGMNNRFLRLLLYSLICHFPAEKKRKTKVYV